MKIRNTIILALLLACSSCYIERLNSNEHIELQDEYFGYVENNHELSSICFNQDGSFILDWWSSNRVLSGKWSRLDEYHINLCIDYNWDDVNSCLDYIQFGCRELVAFLEPDKINILGYVFYSGQKMKNISQRKRTSLRKIPLLNDKIGPTIVADTSCFFYHRRRVEELLQNKDIAMFTDRKPFFIFMANQFDWIVGVKDGDTCTMIVNIPHLLRDTLYHSLCEREIFELFNPKQYKHFSVKHIHDRNQRYYVMFNREREMVNEYNFITIVYNSTPLFYKYPMRTGGLEYLGDIYVEEYVKGIEKNAPREAH